MVGPHFAWFPTVIEGKSITTWAEIGVIFLLFALGLEFSFKKLARVGGAATITTLVEVVIMVFVGYLSGRLFGWSQIDSIFLGGILAISSTTIILRAFDELGVRGRGYVSLVFGILIIEDLVAILLLAVLSTIAASQGFEGSKLVISVLKLIFFLTLWFLAGIFVLPTLLKKAKPLMNKETLLVFSVALCLLMVVLATQAGFSPALGAFIMGSLLAETTEGKKIEHLIEPVKSLFAAVFFVSVGMLIDPKMLTEYAVPVIILTLITIIGKALSTLLGALLSGQSLRHSVQTGLSLAQIGEFSFIIAGLGMALNVTSDFLYPVAVGVSALTTFTTPYLIRSSDWIYSVVEARMPSNWSQTLTRYSAGSQSVSHRSEWSQLLRAYTMKIGINSVLISAVFLGVARFLHPVLSTQLESEGAASAIGLLLALVLSAPFIWALVMRQSTRQAAEHLWQDRKSRGPLFVLESSRWVVAAILFGFLSTQFIAFKVAFGITVVLVVVVLLRFSRKLESIYDWFERRFVQNLSAKDDQDKANAIPPLAPWDAHLVRLQVTPESPMIGKTLTELAIREHYGVTIALIERGSKRIPAPGRHESLYPYDGLAVIGTDQQIEKFKAQVETYPPEGLTENGFNYGLHRYLVTGNSAYIGCSIRDSGIREKSNGLVVGIERQGKRMLNPDSATHILRDDLLWIVCDSDKIHLL